VPRTARYQRLGEKQSRACQRLCPQGLLLKQRFGAGFFGSATCGVRPNSYDRPTKEGPQPHPKTPALRAMPPLRRQCSQPPPGLKARGAAFCALHNIWGFEHEAGPATKEDREPRRRAALHHKGPSPSQEDLGLKTNNCPRKTRHDHTYWPDEIILLVGRNHPFGGWGSGPSVRHYLQFLKTLYTLDAPRRIKGETL
jgi:hypothetical protein